MSRAAFVVLLLFTSLAAGQPPAAEPAKPIINWPVVVQPSPPPSPTATIRLDSESILIFASDAELLWWTIEEGLVSVTHLKGPRLITAKFAGGTGQIEDREYKEKNIYRVKGIKPGTVTIIAIPAGATNKELGQQRRVEVVLGPRPPPGPEPDPKPDPKPEPKPINEGPRFVVIIEETADGVAGRAKLFTDPAISARMKEKGHKFRIVDKDVIGSDGKPPADIARFIEEAKGKTLPMVFFVDQRGVTVQSGPLPATAFLEALKKAGG